MGSEEQLEYGPAARLRVSLAALLADISDFTRDAVPAYPDRDAVPGALAQMAAQVAADASELVTLAVACEHSRGSSWETIAAALGLGNGQAARDLYLSSVTKLDQAIVECWILGDDPPIAGIPNGASGTAAAARHLDAWVTRQQADVGSSTQATACDPDHLFPVSGHLTPLSQREHADLLAVVGALLSERHLQSGPDDPHVRRLELGNARRAVELYERMIAEGPSDAAPSLATLQDLLAGARARLADLTGAREPPGDAAYEKP